MLYTREDIPAKLLSVDKSVESCIVELNLKRTKWLINYLYIPRRNKISAYLDSISRDLDLYFWKFDSYLIVGNFNVSIKETTTKKFVNAIV